MVTVYTANSGGHPPWERYFVQRWRAFDLALQLLCVRGRESTRPLKDSRERMRHLRIRIAVMLIGLVVGSMLCSTASAGVITAYVGGTGGADFLWPYAPPPFAPSPSGAWATGVWGRSGSLVDALGLIFEQFASPAFGGKGGNQFRSVCPWGFRLKGIQGRAGNVVERVQAVCVHVDDVWGANDWRPESPEERIHVMPESYGGNGGNFFSIRCAKGEAVYAFQGRSGKYLDALSLFCSNTVNF